MPSASTASSTAQTEEVDLSRFSSVVDAVVLGLREAGHDAAELLRVDQFARREVTTADGHQVDIDMGVDWREAEPAVLAIGPVLQSRGRRRQQAQRALQPCVRARLPRRRFDPRIREVHRRRVDPLSERDPGFDVPMFVTQLELVHCVLPEQVSQ